MSDTKAPETAELFRLNIVFGWAAPPLTEQLAGLVEQNTAEHLDQDHKAILRLRIRGLITVTERDRLYARLTKKIRKALSTSGDTTGGNHD